MIMNEKQEQELLEACRLIIREGAGDHDYMVARLENAGNHGPRVTAYRKAIDTIIEMTLLEKKRLAQSPTTPYLNIPDHFEG